MEASDTPVAAAADVPAVDLTTPAVAAPPVTVKSPEDILAAIKAKVKSANPALDSSKPPVEEKTPEESKPTEPELNIPPKVLRQLGNLQTKVREQEAKLKDFDALSTDAKTFRELKASWNKDHAGKLEVLAKLAGVDGSDALASLVQYYEAGGESDKPAPSPETKALLDAVTSLTKEVADLKAGKTAEAENAAKLSAETQAAAATEFVKSIIGKHAAKFELCARPENVVEAVDLVNAACLEIAKKDGISLKDISEEDANALYLRAMAEVESEFEATGKRFAKGQPRTVTFNAEKYARPLSRPGLRVVKEPLSPNPKVREQQLRERLHARAEAGEFRR